MVTRPKIDTLPILIRSDIVDITMIVISECTISNRDSIIPSGVGSLMRMVFSQETYITIARITQSNVMIKTAELIEMPQKII